MRIRTAVVGLLALAGSLVLLVARSPAAPGAERVAVVAKGLNNPRGLAIGPSGAIYVAEAGTAGRCVGPEKERVCFGFTGSVTRIKGSSSRRVSRGLLSIGEKDGSFTVGVDDVAVDRKGHLFAIMTSAPVPNPETIVGERGADQLGKLLRLSVGKSVVADVGALEQRRNPDKADVNPNPYALALAKDRILVVDAGGNTLLSALTNGRVSLLAIFPARKVGNKMVQSVPTSVAVGPDGAYYVGELGGDGTPRGAARVWRVVPGEKPAVFATGFDTITAVDFGPDGSLYVGELLRNGFGQLARDDLTGSVVRISADGERAELAPGKLPAVGGIAVAPDGAVYVSTNSVLPRAGQVVRITTTA